MDNDHNMNMNIDEDDGLDDFSDLVSSLSDTNDTDSIFDKNEETIIPNDAGEAFDSSGDESGKTKSNKPSKKTPKASKSKRPVKPSSKQEVEKAPAPRKIAGFNREFYKIIDSKRKGCHLTRGRFMKLMIDRVVLDDPNWKKEFKKVYKNRKLLLLEDFAQSLGTGGDASFYFKLSEHIELIKLLEIRHVTSTDVLGIIIQMGLEGWDSDKELDW